MPLPGNPDTFQFVEQQCGAAEDIAACIEEKTYNQSAIIKDIILGFSAQTSMTSQELWSEDFTHTFYGMGHTLNMETKLNPDDETTQLFIIFQDLSNYMVISLNMMHSSFNHTVCQVYIHDKDYFLVNANPYGLPSIDRKSYSQM